MDEDATTERLIERIRQGDLSAAGELVNLHRERLWRMVTFRLDPRLCARLDASDVVQEALAEAVQRLPDYVRQRPLPFYPWLRRITWQTIIHLQRWHLDRQKRSVLKERDLCLPVTELSRIELARQLAVSTSGPSKSMRREEQAARVQQAIKYLRPSQREVLLLRYVELLSVREVAAVLHISEAAVKMRHIRALERLRDLLEDVSTEP